MVIAAVGLAAAAAAAADDDDDLPTAATLAVDTAPDAASPAVASPASTTRHELRHTRRLPGFSSMGSEKSSTMTAYRPFAA